MPVPELPPGQARVYWAMVDHRNAHGVWPTLREVARQLGVSKTTAYGAVQTLIVKAIAGRAEEQQHNCYFIRPEHMPPPESVVVPILGSVK